MDPIEIQTTDIEAILEHRVDSLPPLARAKVEALLEAEHKERIEREAKYKAHQALIEKKNEVQAAIALAEREKARSAVDWRDEDEARLEKLRTKEKRYHEQLRPVKNDAPKFTGDAKRRVDFIRESSPPPLSWLASQPPHAIWAEKRAELPSGNLKKALDSCRVDQSTKVDRAAYLDRALIDLESALAKSDSGVDRIAAKGRPDVRPVTSWRKRGGDGSRKSQGEIQWPTPDLYDQGLHNADTSELGISLICWLFGPQIKKRLRDEVRELYQATGDNGVSAHDREREMRELRAQLLELQRLEVRICDKLGVEHGPVHPLALFEMERLPDAPRKVNPEAGGRVMPPGTPPTLGAKLAAKQ